MEHSHGQEEPPPQVVRHGADAGPEPAPGRGTVVFRSPGAAAYGRPAAPLSAYGPSDVHRLLPVPPTGSGAMEQADSGDALVEVEDSAAPTEVLATGDRSLDELSMKTTGFWARLRPLPRAA